jgi:hypothetical protein
MTAQQVAALPRPDPTSSLPACTANLAAQVDATTPNTEIRASDPNQVITLVKGDVLTVLAYPFQPQPAFAAKSPFCRLGSNDATAAFLALRTGNASIYFVSQHGVTTDPLVIETPPSSARLLSFPIGLVLLLAGLIGLALRFRQQYDTEPQDLRRADEAQEGDSYDPSKANQAAFDAFDLHSRP